MRDGQGEVSENGTGFVRYIEDPGALSGSGARAVSLGSMWENIVVIGIMEDRRIWSNRGGFPADGADGAPRKPLLSYCLLRDLGIPGGGFGNMR